MYWRLLSTNRDFRLLYIGTLISLGGDWVHEFMLSEAKHLLCGRRRTRFSPSAQEMLRFAQHKLAA